MAAEAAAAQSCWAKGKTNKIYVCTQEANSGAGLLMFEGGGELELELDEIGLTAECVRC